jgi:hypothetical protein
LSSWRILLWKNIASFNYNLFVLKGLEWDHNSALRNTAWVFCAQPTPLLPTRRSGGFSHASPPPKIPLRIISPTFARRSYAVLVLVPDALREGWSAWGSLRLSRNRTARRTLRLSMPLLNSRQHNQSCSRTSGDLTAG